MKKLINILILLVIAIPGVFAISVSRDLPTSASANIDFNVVLTLSGYSGQAAAIVRDNIPTGCAYVSGGVLEGTQIKTVLGSLTSNTLTYTIKCPSGTYSFSGTYDGGNLGAGSIDGEASLNVGGSSCTPNWQIGTWTPPVCPSSCTQTRTCVDLNDCGIIGCPFLSQSCTGGNCNTGTISVSRDLPSYASSNTNFNIVVTLSASGQSAVIVRDNIPSGCTYVSGGAKEGNQVKTVLGSLTSNTLTYVLNCPYGTYLFSGTYDGGDLGAGSIGGESSLSVGASQCTTGARETCKVVKNYEKGNFKFFDLLFEQIEIRVFESFRLIRGIVSGSMRLQTKEGIDCKLSRFKIQNGAINTNDMNISAKGELTCKIPIELVVGENGVTGSYQGKEIFKISEMS